MSKITIAIVIMVMIIWLFYATQKSNVENLKVSNINSPGDINIGVSQSHVVLTDQLTIPENKKKHIKIMPNKKCIVKQNNNIITKSEINDGHLEICPKDSISIKQFNTEFFNFRDKIENNSSMVLDPVDKITDLFLDGTIWNTPVGETKPIGEIYDQLTKRPDFGSDCTRIPSFDSVMYDGYTPTQLTGLYSSGEEWIYKNENENNGGQLEKRLYSHDTNFSGQYPLSAFPPMKSADWAG